MFRYYYDVLTDFLFILFLKYTGSGRLCILHNSPAPVCLFCNLRDNKTLN